MEYVRLGQSGLEVSRIAMGCMSFGDNSRSLHAWSLDEDTSQDLVVEAVDVVDVDEVGVEPGQRGVQRHFRLQIGGPAQAPRQLGRDLRANSQPGEEDRAGCPARHSECGSPPAAALAPVGVSRGHSRLAAGARQRSRGGLSKGGVLPRLSIDGYLS